MRTRFWPYMALVLGAVGMQGCAVAAHRSSPWEFGGGFRVAPGFAMRSSEETTIHPMASYTYLSFDGGYDGLIEVGGQVRQRITPASGSGLWIGGEAAISRLTTHIDGYSQGTESNNGWSLTALVGAPVGKSRWGVNLYAGAGLSNYGSSGKNLRAGVDLQPWFLKREKK